MNKKSDAAGVPEKCGCPGCLLTRNHGLDVGYTMNNKELAKLMSKAWHSAHDNGLDNDDCWESAALTAQEALCKPKPKVQNAKVKSKSEIIRLLVDGGYEASRNWNWTKRECITFTAIMFESCGKEPDPAFIWLTEWLETTVVIPAKDEPVMVRNSNSGSWKRRYSAGEVNNIGKLLCYPSGNTSWSSEDLGITTWEFYRSPTEEELNDNQDQS